MSEQEQRTESECRAVLELCRSLFEMKLHDYGAAWRILRPESLTDQIYIKAERIRSIQIRGEAHVPEGIDSEFVGIVNYGLIGMIQLELGPVSRPDLDASTALSLYDRFAEATLQRLLSKNHDYGEAWRNMRLSSMIDIILTKIYRTKQIEDNRGQTFVSEGIEANYMDMVNYALFCLVQLAENGVRVLGFVGGDERFVAHGFAHIAPPALLHRREEGVRVLSQIEDDGSVIGDRLEKLAKAVGPMVRVKPDEIDLGFEAADHPDEVEAKRRFLPRAGSATGPNRAVFRPKIRESSPPHLRGGEEGPGFAVDQPHELAPRKPPAHGPVEDLPGGGLFKRQIDLRFVGQAFEFRAYIFESACLHGVSLPAFGAPASARALRPSSVATCHKSKRPPSSTRPSSPSRGTRSAANST